LQHFAGVVVSGLLGITEDEGCREKIKEGGMGDGAAAAGGGERER
jgi:hypothetical protein